MDISTIAPFSDMYVPESTLYGNNWQSTPIFAKSFTQSRAYKTLTETRKPIPHRLPKDLHAVSLVHNPESPCGIMTMSNVPSNRHGAFTNVRRDLFSDRQGLWSNAMHNTSGAHICCRPTFGTYSNLQGAWGRIGPSTYDSVHGNGEWVLRWGVRDYEAPTLRSLRDHRNIDPRDNAPPIFNVPQNMPY